MTLLVFIFENFFTALGMVIIALLIVGIAGAIFLKKYIPFADEREYIKEEIALSDPIGRKKWKRRLLELYIGCIPIVRDVYWNVKRKRRAKERRKREKQDLAAK